MGNCLKRSRTDDISLLREEDRSSAEARNDSSDHLSSPPAYYSEILQPGFHPTPSVSRQVGQMTEEEQIRIAKRIGLIQHLPVGYYDGSGSNKRDEECSQKKSNQFNINITDDPVTKKGTDSGEEAAADKDKDDVMTSSTSSTNSRSECVICMNEFLIGDRIRYLPCLHVYHDHCIDDWLIRSLTCPSCLEPVDAALLQTYETNS